MKANFVAISAINNSVERLLLTPQFSKSNFFMSDTKADGTVSSITVNTQTTNLFKSRLSKLILESINQYEKEVIEMAPFSTYGYSVVPFGIRVPVLVVPVEILSTDFSVDLQESGINQTLYQLNVEIVIAVKLLLPIGSESFNVQTKVPVVQTVIVGNIPDAYTNVEGAEDTGPNTILDIAS